VRRAAFIAYGACLAISETRSKVTKLALAVFTANSWPTVEVTEVEEMVGGGGGGTASGCLAIPDSVCLRVRSSHGNGKFKIWQPAFALTLMESFARLGVEMGTLSERNVNRERYKRATKFAVALSRLFFLLKAQTALTYDRNTAAPETIGAITTNHA
jgi:hypothetical protein